MKIVLATIQTPFIEGGAEYMIRGLQSALKEEGHLVERVSMPFRFSPVSQVQRSLEIWGTEDLTSLNGHQADRVICLQFPTYYLRHPAKVLLLMHQFRLVYDLWDTPYGAGFALDPGANKLREAILDGDTCHLAAIDKRYTIAANVSRRLLHYNQITSTPLYHPPFGADAFFSGEPEPYILAPSRLEQTKRQDLLIRAMAYVDRPTVAVLCGAGGQRPALEALATELDLRDRVHFLGHVSEEEKRGLYAHAACVFFGPYDEDYGYVTLEAMLSSKALVTCKDSGGPLEFVVDQETGLVTEPDPQEIARALNRLMNRPLAERMGQSAREHYEAMDISWENVVRALTT